MVKKKNVEAWKEAKKRCRLNELDIQMAKELGMSPRGLIRNIPAPNELWKAPVKVWIRDLYEEKFGEVLTVAPDEAGKKQKEQKQSKVSESWDDEDLPF